TIIQFISLIRIREIHLRIPQIHADLYKDPFRQPIDVAAPKTPVKNRSYGTLEMESGKSSLRYTLNSHCHCGDCITRRRPPVWITRSLLGCDRHARCDAVNPWCNSVDFDRTHC